MKVAVITLILSFFLVACAQKQTQVQSSSQEPSAMLPEKYQQEDYALTERIEKTEAEWKAQMTKDEFYVMREKGTERAFTGKYWDNKAEGIYTCGACGLPLFSSETKFKSGTGWPSFYAKIHDSHVKEETDRTFGMVRTEVLCARCDAHLGHVFSDGPRPTGLRYCINSVSLNFKATDEKATANKDDKK